MRGTPRRRALKTTLASILGALLLCACSGPPELLVDTPFVDRADLEFDGGRLERTLDITGGAVMQGTAEVILQHRAPEDLTVTVVTPASTRIVLGGRIAEGGDDHRYAVPLLDAQGEPSAGAWRLEIVDAGTSGPGRLYVWAVDIGGGPPAP